MRGVLIGIELLLVIAAVGAAGYYGFKTTMLLLGRRRRTAAPQKWQVNTRPLGTDSILVEVVAEGETAQHIGTVTTTSPAHDLTRVVQQAEQVAGNLNRAPRVRRAR